MGFFRCWSVRNILDLYVDERLMPGTMLRVQAHLKTCADCREEKEALAPVLPPNAAKIAVPEGLKESILEKLEKGEVPQSAPVTLGETLRLSPAQAFSLAYCALLISAHAVPGGRISQAYSADAAEVIEAHR